MAIGWHPQNYEDGDALRLPPLARSNQQKTTHRKSERQVKKKANQLSLEQLARIQCPYASAQEVSAIIDGWNLCLERHNTKYDYGMLLCEVHEECAHHHLRHSARCLPKGTLRWLRQHVPVEKLSEVESFVSNITTNVTTVHLPSAYHRAILHVVCRWWGFDSCSWDDEEGQRVTQITQLCEDEYLYHRPISLLDHVFGSGLP